MGGNSSHPDDEMDCRAKGSSGSIPLKPLRFHDVYSSGIVSPNKLVMRRMDQGWGITFSNRPLDVDEIICLKIVMFHKGFLRFGLTSQDPSQLDPHSLEKFRFDSSKRTIIKELSASCTRKDTMIFLKMNAAGEVVYSWQRNEKSKDKGVLFGGITLDVPLWAVFEISGKNLAVKLEVDNIPLIRTKSFKKITHLKKSRSVEYLQSSRSIFNIDPANINESFSKLPSKRIKTPKSSDRFPRAKSFSISYPAVYVPMEVSDAVSPGPENHVENTANLFNIPLSNIDFQTEDLPAYSSNAEKANNNPNNKLSSNEECKTSMCFHRSVGKNISLSSDQMTATRTVGNCNGYIFTRRPLEANEKFKIKLLQVNPEVGGSLGFGVTVCDPSQVSHFPDDADLLLDRQEYWVVIKNLYKNPVANDEISFLLTKTGEVVMFKNNVCLKTIVHVDPTLSLWIFFDLCGSVEKISSQG
ncbi:hypothetical protein HELRODRAFT_191354 [Helobdella robusta]|uniref:NHR domain-containing protein n=1 Tax=Helobdella robusta TaxID=6412 RepID=T1FSX0_HELRO|nr:hypothetical protein HELRODRAFT_191354 [Helobdella robusta]ESO05690.1 hypothetical protein HELRODRAFT_191354 [Helobdella robusta]